MVGSESNNNIKQAIPANPTDTEPVRNNAWGLDTSRVFHRSPQPRTTDIVLDCINRHPTPKNTAHDVRLVHSAGGSPGIKPRFNYTHDAMFGQGGEEGGDGIDINNILINTKHIRKPVCKRDAPSLQPAMPYKYKQNKTSTKQYERPQRSKVDLPGQR